MISDSTLYRLKQFIAGYFHEDMDIHGPTWEDVLQAAMDDRTPAELREMAAALRQYADDHEDGPELKRLMLYELGSCLRTEAVGFTPRQWLYRAAELVREEADRRSMARA